MAKRVSYENFVRARDRDATTGLAPLFARRSLATQLWDTTDANNRWNDALTGLQFILRFLYPGLRCAPPWAIEYDPVGVDGRLPLAARSWLAQRAIWLKKHGNGGSADVPERREKI